MAARFFNHRQMVHSGSFALTDQLHLTAVCWIFKLALVHVYLLLFITTEKSEGFRVGLEVVSLLLGGPGTLL